MNSELGGGRERGKQVLLNRPPRLMPQRLNMQQYTCANGAQGWPRIPRPPSPSTNAAPVFIRYFLRKGSAQRLCVGPRAPQSQTAPPCVPTHISPPLLSDFGWESE